MKNLAVIYIGLLLVFAAPPAMVLAGDAGRTPEGLKLRNGTLIRWGTSQQAAIAAAGNSHVQYEGETMLMEGVFRLKAHPSSCGIHGDIIPEPYRQDGILLFNQDRLYGVVLMFDPENFERVERGIVSAVGSPSRRTAGVVQNRMGASFDQVEDTWTTGAVRIDLHKRADKIDEGRLEIYYLPLRPAPMLSNAPAPF